MIEIVLVLLLWFVDSAPKWLQVLGTILLGGSLFLQFLAGFLQEVAKEKTRREK